VATQGRITGFTTAISDIDTLPQEQLGAIRCDVTYEYKYVQFAGTEAAAVGDFCCYTDDTLLIVDPTNAAVGAGVAAAAHPSGSVTYGWLQIRGLATMSTALGGPPSVGNKLKPGADHAMAVASAETDVQYGICIHVTAPILVDLTCPNGGGT
jgi:hypothetical protein